MKWFLLIFFLLCFLLFWLGIWIEKMKMKEDIDHVYRAKWDRIREKWKRYTPYEKFAYNLFWWIMVFLVFYYIYLG